MTETPTADCLTSFLSEEIENAALEHETVAAMLSYRHYLGVAQHHFHQLCHLSTFRPEGRSRLAQATKAYRSAVKKLDGQHSQLVRLIDRLGYVPKVDRKLFH